MMESFMERRRFGRNLLILFLFSLPVLYLGAILAVSFHEILGHGLAGLFLGGRFKGFGIGLDGMGWADVDVKGFTVPRTTLMLAAGAACTTLFSLLFFALCRVLRKSLHVQLVFLILGFSFMLDGLPYYFWDAILLGGIGDFSVLFLLHPIGIMRVVTIALCGLAMAAAIILSNAWYYRIALRLLGEGTQVNRRGRIALSLMIFLQQAFCWFVFDWDQIVPGVGLLPALAGVAVSGVTLLGMVVSRTTADQDGSRETEWRFKAPMIAVWTACIGTVLCIALWLRNGVTLPS
jgi:hypothetical protein